MNTNNTYIVCYDGDGGGLCGHLRHRFELFMLGEIANINIIDHYPYTRMLFKGTITADEILSKENTILMDELIENSEEFYGGFSFLVMLQLYYYLPVQL